MRKLHSLWYAWKYATRDSYYKEESSKIDYGQVAEAFPKTEASFPDVSFRKSSFIWLGSPLKTVINTLFIILLTVFTTSIQSLYGQLAGCNIAIVPDDLDMQNRVQLDLDDACTACGIYGGNNGSEGMPPGGATGCAIIQIRADYMSDCMTIILDPQSSEQTDYYYDFNLMEPECFMPDGSTEGQGDLFDFMKEDLTLENGFYHLLVCSQSSGNRFFEVVDGCCPDPGSDAEVFACPGSEDEIDLFATLDGADMGGTWDRISGSGGTVNLVTGTYTPGMDGTSSVFTYTLPEIQQLPDCDYISEVTVTLEDITEPEIVCDDLVLALSYNDPEIIDADTLIESMSDECGIIVSVQARRMEDPFACGYPDNEIFSDSIGFCCADVGQTIMVELIVIDDSGNESPPCMVEVTVVDEVAPRIWTCADDVTISCSYDFDLNDLSEFGTLELNQEDVDPLDIDDEYFQQTQYGDAKEGMFQENCPGWTVRTVVTDERECNQGDIIRKFYVTDASGNSDSCEQRITVLDIDPFSWDDIIWPVDVDYEDCSLLLPNPGPGPDPDETGRPTFNINDLCSQPMATFKDLFFDDPTSGCIKVQRTWKVIDWCTYDKETKEGSWTWEQYIKIINTISPVWESVPDTLDRCVVGTGCASDQAFAISATDDCTLDEDLTYLFEVDLNNDGEVDTTGVGNEITVFMEKGTHKILWTVEDRCGNDTMRIQIVNVKECKAPTPICYWGLAASLSQQGETVIWASDFNNKSNDNCTAEEDLIFSFSSDTDSTSMVLTCEDIGEKLIQMWVTDECGNQSYCETYILVQDSHEVCPDQDIEGCCDNVNVYGDSDINTPWTIKHYDGFTYIASDVFEGDSLYGVFTKFDGNNEVVWSFQLEKSSRIFDFTKTESDEFILVGRTEFARQGSTDMDNTSFLFKISGDGNLIFYREYDSEGRESFRNIVLHHNPLNVSFPYYISGFENPANDSPSATDEVKLLNIDTNGNINWVKEYAYSSDDQWILGLLPLDDGNLILSGDYEPGFNGVIVKLDGFNGNIIESKQSQPTPTEIQARFYSLKEMSDGRFIAVGWFGTPTTRTTNRGMIGLFDENLDFINALEYSNSIINEITDVELDDNDNFIAVGRRFSSTGIPVLIKGSIENNMIVIEDQKYFQNSGDMSIANPSIFISDNQLYYTDGRENNNIGFGGRDIYFGSFDIELSDDCLQDTLITPDVISFNMVDINITSEDYILPNPSLNIAFEDVSYNNIPLCDIQPPSQAMIAGYIGTENSTPVREVQVNISGPELDTYQMTNSEGEYAFEALDAHYNYEVIPVKDDDPTVGVSTLDLVIVQQHILGIKELESPYKLIAADVNNSESISAIDLIQLRKMILGIYDAFPENNSWRFIESQYGILEAASPWPFIEGMYVEDLSEDMMDNNFIAVKIGDVNGSVEEKLTREQVETRSSEKWVIGATDRFVKAGEMVEMTLTGSGLRQMIALQWTLSVDSDRISVVGWSGRHMAVSDDHFGLVDGEGQHLTFAWTDLESKSFEKGSELMTITLLAREDGKLSELVEFGSTITPAVGYNASREKVDIIWTWEEEAPGEVVLYQNAPNPFMERTSISFDLPGDMNATIELYDVSGKLMYRKNDFYNHGKNTIFVHSSEIDGLPGVVYYVLKTESNSITKKMILLR